MTIYYFQHNILVEKNRSIIEEIKNIISRIKIPKYLWKEATKTMNYIQNKYPRKVLHWVTLEEAFIIHKPNLLHLCVFGYVAYCYISLLYLNKLNSKALSTLFIGYEKNSDAY